MEAQKINIEELALDLLDFCGGAEPSESDFKKWELRRYSEVIFHTSEKNCILQTARQLLTNP